MDTVRIIGEYFLLKKIYLRTAIEAQLLGCRTVVVENRTGFTRNNVLKLWKFLIEVIFREALKKYNLGKCGWVWSGEPKLL